MKKGINVVTIPSGLTIEEQIKLAEDAGYQTIEFNLSETHEKELDISLDSTNDELEYIRRLIDQSSLKVESLSTVLHWKYSLSSRNDLLRKKGIEIAKKMVDMAHFFKADTILIVPGVVTEEDDYIECYKKSQESLLSICSYAEDKGIMIGIENVDNRFLLSPLEAKNYIDDLNLPNLGFYFDVGNILPYGFPHQWIKILSSRIVKIHVKDHSDNGTCQLLAGNVNWKKVICALKEIDYEGPLTCELNPYKYFGEQLAYDTSRALDVILNLG